MGVLENINIHDGSGNTLTSTANALDVNLKTSAATVTVAQPTGTNLHTVLDSGTLTNITDPVTVVQPTASNLHATVELEDGAGNALTSTGNALDSNLKTIGGTAVQTGTGTSGAGIPRVTVSNDSKAQPWDGTNSAKFDATGETTADITRFGGTAVTIGQKVMASSIPIVIAVDQSPIPVSGVFNIQNGTTQSGNIPNALNGTLAIINNDFIWSTLTLNFIAPLPNSSPVLSLGGEFQLEGSIDNVNWTALTGTLLSDTPTQVTQYTTTGFLSCAARYNLAGFPWIRIRTTNPFTGTINVQQALTTAIGDEVSFTTAKIVDDAGQTVDLTPPAQYTEGQNPSVAYFQGGLATLPSFAATQIIDPANAAFVLPKRSQIGNTLVVAVVIQGTNLTAANLAPMTLSDTAGSFYTLAELYDSTVTSAGQAIAIYAKTITAVDNEGQIGFLLLYGGTIGAGQPITSIAGISILAQEYSGVTLTGDAFAHVLTPSTASSATSAPIATGAGYLVYSLISGQEPSSQLADVLTIRTGGDHLTTGDFQLLDSDPVQSCTGDNLSSYESLGMAWDWVCVKLPVATTGTVMMGRLTSPDGPIQAIQIDPTSGGVLTKVTNNDPTSPFFVAVTNPVAITVSSSNFPVQLQDGASEPISSTSGSLNVNVTNSPLPVAQSGTWSVTATNPSVSTVGSVAQGQATMVGALTADGTVELLRVDADHSLNVNIAAGSASTNPAASATGSTVPADASYTGFNSGGNLVGQTGFSLTNSKAAAVAIVDANGNQITNLAEQQYLNGSATGSSVTGTVAMGLSPAGATVALSLDTLGHLNTNIVNTPSVTVSGTPTVTISGTPAVISKTQDGEGNNLTSTGGALNVNVTGGSASGTQYAAGTAVPTPTGTVSLGTDGTDVRVLSTTSTGALNVVAAPVAITGASGAAVEAAQGTAAPAHVIQVGGVFNATSPSIGSGDITALQTDSGGSLKVSLAGSTVTPLVQIQSSGTNLTNTGGALNVNVTNTDTNGAAAAGSAVPADASYTGFNSGGDLVGVSSTNPFPVTVVGGGGGGSTQYSSGSIAGTTPTGTMAMGANGSFAVALSANASGVLHVDGSGVTQPVSGTVSANIASGGTAITNTSGALDVNIKSGAASGTQYATGTAVATPTGTVAMGWDGTDVRSLSTDTSGNQNVNLFVGGSPNGVLHPVAISASGSANSSSNPISIAVTDGTGKTSAMAAVGTAPAATANALPVAAVLYAGATPTAIGTPVAAGTGALSGNALTCNSPVYVGTAPASASNPLAVSARLTDGTTVIAGAVSPLGSAPAGNAVLNVNTVALPSAALGAAMNAKFINASGAAGNIKASAGNLYGFSLTNSTASPAFVEFFNTNGTPTLGTTAVAFCVVIPASGNVTINPTTMGLMNFSSGIGFAVTTAENGTTTAGVTGMIFYA